MPPPRPPPAKTSPGSGRLVEAHGTLNLTGKPATLSSCHPGERTHELHVTHACVLWRNPPGSPRPGRLRSPPRRQPADGCHHPKFRAGWAGRALGPEGRREGGGQQVPGTARPAQSPVSPFREAGPPGPSLGFVFLTARLTGDCWLRAPARARLSGSCGHIWKMFGRALAPCPPVAGLRAAADKRLLPAPAWAPGSCRLRPTALTSGAGRGGAEGMGAIPGLGPPASSRNHRVAEPTTSTPQITSEAN